jgi:hypothetical protein
LEFDYPIPLERLLDYSARFDLRALALAHGESIRQQMLKDTWQLP